MPALTAVAIAVVSFALGSVPFSNLAARRVAGVDLRHVGSGTVSGTSLYRVAGFVPLAIAGILDVAKGSGGPLLAGGRPLLGAIAGGLAVAGHDWSPFLRGAGGRGLSPALGALLVLAWPGAVVLLGGLVLGKAAGETGLGSFVALVLLAPVLGLTHGAAGATAGAAVALPVAVKRVVGNRRPARPDAAAYAHRLVFDCDPGERT